MLSPLVLLALATSICFSGCAEEKVEATPAPVQLAQNEAAPQTEEPTPAAEEAPIVEVTSGAATLDTEEARMGYTLGLQMGQQLRELGALDYAALALGVQDAVEDNDPKVTEEQMMQAMQKLQEKMMAAQMAEQAELSERGDALATMSAEILAANKENGEISVTESGLQYQVIEEGTGATPAASDSVTVHYTGTFADGEVFDSSVERGEPTTFNVGGVIPGWTEALQLMKEGAKYKLWIPGDLAYGPQGRPGIPPNAMLNFEVELISIN
jgi:FKBP-type peptidyl-prolyl cis-trans isomerase